MSEEAKLIVWIGGRSEREIPLQADQVIGRVAEADIIVEDNKVSKRHAQLWCENGDWYLRDLQSTNGTFVDGTRLLLDQPAPLHHGSRIRVGDTELSCQFDQAVEEPTQVTMLASELIIGRDPACDIVLDYPNVSRRHCKITRSSHGYVLEDLNSRNGTYLNGVRIMQPERIGEGDEVRVGLTLLLFHRDTLERYEQNGTVRLDAAELNLVVSRSGKPLQLLHEVSFVIPPKEFVAIVGASGAGKTTLLNAMTGFHPASKGRILLNGVDFYSHLQLFRTAIGYVPQEDIVHRELTVAAVLRYAAQLRLPPDTGTVEIERLVDTTLKELELSHRKDASIATLSGGERKRVNVGVELLTRPSLLFLDEPTSGLDPGLERKFIELVKRLTDEGRTIVMVTHATSSITQCDKLLFMARGGRVAYYGPPQEALTFFGVDDYADAYIQVNYSSLPPEHWETKYRESEYYERYIQTPRRNAPQRQQGQSIHIAKGLGATQPRPAAWEQFLILCRRYVATFFGDPRNVWFLLAQSPIIALLLMAVFPSNAFEGRAYSSLAAKAPLLLFCMVISAILFGIINAAKEITKESAIYRRERLINLRIFPYLLSKGVVLAGLCVLQSALLVGLIGFRIDYRLEGAELLAFWFTILLANISGMLLGLAVSTLANSNDQAMALVPIAVLPQIIFSGLIDIDNLKWLSNLMPSYWAYGALGNLTQLRGKSLFDITIGAAWPALIGISGAYLLFSYFVLVSKEKRAR